MFIWRKSEFVMEERFKEFKINEGKIGERLQGNIPGLANWPHALLARFAPDSATPGCARRHAAERPSPERETGSCDGQQLRPEPNRLETTATKTSRRGDKSIRAARPIPSQEICDRQDVTRCESGIKRPPPFGSCISRVEIMATIVMSMTAEKSERNNAAQRGLGRVWRFVLASNSDKQSDS